MNSHDAAVVDSDARPFTPALDGYIDPCFAAAEVVAWTAQAWMAPREVLAVEPQALVELAPGGGAHP